MVFGLQRLVPAVRCLLPAARQQTTQIRKASAGDWRYREINLNVDKKQLMKAEFVGFVMWYWILFHLWYQWDHVAGHHVPDPLKWTDEELGIPPDEED